MSLLLMLSRRGTPPIANFVASKTAPLTLESITFTDQSTNTPTSWLWNFGDSVLSTSQNPSHAYSLAGTYTVSLAATNAGGTNTKTRTNYIVVTDIAQGS